MSAVYTDDLPVPRTAVSFLAEGDDSYLLREQIHDMQNSHKMLLEHILEE